MKEIFLILDSNSILYRAFYALPKLTTKKGEPTGAIYGFLLVFFKAIRELKPDYTCACFDHPAPTFRHKKFKDYKITRAPTPKELPSQISKTKEILKNFQIPIFEKEGFEADDLIGTIVQQAKKEKPFLEIIILSGDNDVFQLANKNVKICFLKKGVKNWLFFDEKDIEQKYGLKPNQLSDFKALVGDPSDNIPGVSGIGKKTAIELIKEFGNIENLYSNLEKIKKINLKTREILINQKEKAFLSKQLAEINTSIPLNFKLNNCQLKEYPKEKIIEIFKELEFKSLINKLPNFKKDEKNVKIEKNTQKTLFDFT